MVRSDIKIDRSVFYRDTLKLKKHMYRCNVVIVTKQRSALTGLALHYCLKCHAIYHGSGSGVKT